MYLTLTFISEINSHFEHRGRLDYCLCVEIDVSTDKANELQTTCSERRKSRYVKKIQQGKAIVSSHNYCCVDQSEFKDD